MKRGVRDVGDLGRIDVDAGARRAVPQRAVPQCAVPQRAAPDGVGRRFIAGISKAASVIRRIAGMPDYAVHVHHLRQCHPDHPIPTERAFFEQYLSTRYGGGPTRCC